MNIYGFKQNFVWTDGLDLTSKANWINVKIMNYVSIDCKTLHMTKT